jgi:CheY-like chemotaxis protein
MTPRAARVLLVDDYPDALETWGLYLRTCGFEVITAVNGNEAVDVAMTRKPDVIVMDLELPGISGYEAARRLRRMAETATIPLIAATGYSHGNQLAEAQQAGFDVILVKPCDPGELVAEIERRLDTSRAARGGQSPATNG